MNFQISEKLDDEFVFLINWSAIEGRLDPMTYHKDRLSAIESLQNSSFKTEPLKRIAKFRRDNVSSIPTEETIYVGLENVASNTGEFIETDEKESISTASVFKKGDILFPKLRPYLNKVFYADFDGVCSTEFHVISDSKVKKKYLANFLRSSLVVRQTSKLMSGNTLPRLQTEDIHNLIIPIPPDDIQKSIIRIIEKAQDEKKRKVAEADKLLKSIDDYLLEELGIEVPEKDNSIGNRIFKTNFGLTTGNRVDPDYHLNRLLFQKMNPKYSFRKLSEALSTPPQYGANESAIDGNQETDVRYIRITDIDEEGYLKEGGWQTAEKTNDRYLLEKDDILYARTGSVGRCFLYKPEYGKAIFAGYLIRFKLDKKVLLPEFLFYYSYSKVFELWKNMIQRPTVQANINSEEFKNLLVPIPPMEVQKRIVSEIKKKRSKVVELRGEANQVIEKAKNRIEEIILN